jgi:ATP adenylyltransferase
MVAPVRHVGNFTDLTNDEIISLGRMVKKSMDVLNKTMKPEGFNIGINLGLAAGAGIRDHMHIHVVPRWCGDTNFMPVTAETKVLGEALDELYLKLKNNW